MPATSASAGRTSLRLPRPSFQPQQAVAYALPCPLSSSLRPPPRPRNCVPSPCLCTRLKTGAEPEQQQNSACADDLPNRRLALRPGPCHDVVRLAAAPLPARLPATLTGSLCGPPRPPRERRCGPLCLRWPCAARAVGRNASLPGPRVGRLVPPRTAADLTCMHSQLGTPVGSAFHNRIAGIQAAGTRRPTNHLRSGGLSRPRVGTPGGCR